MHVAETPQKIVLASLSNWDLVDVAALEAKMAKMAPPVRLRSRSGIATTCHVKDCWVESPNLGLEKAKSLRRAKSSPDASSSHEPASRISCGCEQPPLQRFNHRHSWARLQTPLGWNQESTL
ncbi:unnamed protein product [Zymoseptoria tritici ST99CH_3D7]|uniref:Uncharacterized protein n=1 Tax=Zymoseptoria tritici (strain ST99CH_3D7) TaxID=1276538 RepID=A0A1X7S316_ZYMT9|nr:unnamed protein product [Zymoseptoria tritici ST99CH_3D7]